MSLSAHVEIDGSPSQRFPRIVAEFPISALGGLRPGQSARFHMRGLLASKDGGVSARLSRIVRTIRDGSVIIEFWIDSKSRSRMPLLNGLPGSVEVEIERVSPAALILRSAGALASSN
ncbi:MAG: hypothetical protein JOY62_01605 [Acidobacteriaceae bacterium]|nr:hypothetical protein [Acidobacteriaceae bacterium]